jgi:hypothetical protein
VQTTYVTDSVSELTVQREVHWDLHWAAVHLPHPAELLAPAAQPRTLRPSPTRGFCGKSFFGVVFLQSLIKRDCLMRLDQDIHSVNQRLNMEFNWAPGCSFTHWLRPRNSPLPRIWAHIRGRYWSAKIDYISTSLCNPLELMDRPQRARMSRRFLNVVCILNSNNCSRSVLAKMQCLVSKLTVTYALVFRSYISFILLVHRTIYKRVTCYKRYE